MNRREVVKSLALSSALLCFPEFVFTKPKEKLPLHIVGLGRFGRNMVRHLQKNNVKAEYTCIYRSNKPGEVFDISYIWMDCDEIEENVKTNYFELFDFEQHKYLFNDEAKSLFSENHHYILFAGLGNFVGSFMAMNVSEYLEQEKKSFQIVTVAPYRFSGKRQLDNTKTVLEKMKNRNNHYHLENDEILQHYRYLTLSEANEKMNEIIYNRFLEIYPS